MDKEFIVAASKILESTFTNSNLTRDVTTLGIPIYMLQGTHGVQKKYPEKYQSNKKAEFLQRGIQALGFKIKPFLLVC